MTEPLGEAHPLDNASQHHGILPSQALGSAARPPAEWPKPQQVLLPSVETGLLTSPPPGTLVTHNPVNSSPASASEAQAGGRGPLGENSSA